tara:strand:+ start:3686 stop:4399 length:714 start_codon:yes stop_codon:yes gene_type:complete
MNKMILHCGGKEVSYDELAAVPLPEETSTYIPVSFADIVKNAKQIADDLLKDHTYKDSQYALAGKDQRMFSVLRYYSCNDEMGLAIGVRSSYDKSMSNGFCIGASIFVCDNLAFSGDITYMRKHTKNVLEDLEKEMTHKIYSSQKNFNNILEDKFDMTKKLMTNNQAYEFIGKLYGYNVIKPRQLAETFRNWKKPPHEEFQERNMWSLYNACTEALKSTPPNRILEQHIKLHNYATA